MVVDTKSFKMEMNILVASKMGCSMVTVSTSGRTEVHTRVNSSRGGGRARELGKVSTGIVLRASILRT